MSDSSSVEEQLREWVGQLAPEHRQLLLMMLTEDDLLQGSTRLDFAVSQLRKLCKQRGFDWDRMAESDRESFLDNLIRETELYATQAGPPSIVPVLPCSCCGRDVTPSDLYRIYFGERPPSVEVAIGKLILMDMDISAQFPLPADNEITIGRVDPHRGIRPDIDLSKYDPASRISRRHARITSRGGQFYIEDLGSANGSFVNGRTRLKPQEPYPLVNGDVLKIGETTLKFAV
jgi:FHA domain-containing protein